MDSLNIQVTKPRSLAVLPGCRSTFVDSNGHRAELTVGFFHQTIDPSTVNIVSGWQPPFTVDLANATPLMAGSSPHTVQFSFDMPTSLVLLSHLPFQCLDIHPSFRQVSGYTNILKIEVPSKLCATCHKEVEDGSQVLHHMLSSLFALVFPSFVSRNPVVREGCSRHKQHDKLDCGRA